MRGEDHVFCLNVVEGFWYRQSQRSGERARGKRYTPNLRGVALMGFYIQNYNLTKL